MNGIILGAGISGLSTAIALRQLDIEVEVYEASRNLSATGTGILVQPNAMNILDRYGLLQQVIDAGQLIESFVIADSSGKSIMDLPAHFSRNGASYQTVAIHRGILQNILIDNLPANVIISGKRCVGVELLGDGVNVSFSDATKIDTNFLIGADGINSIIRKSIYSNCKPRYSGQTCWRGVANLSLPNAISQQFTEIWDKGRTFGFVPINNSQVYWFATKLENRGGIGDNKDLKRLLVSLYKEHSKVAEEIILQTDIKSIIRNDLHDLPSLKFWSKKSVVLIGDAAHATMPNLGQGGAQAIEDSWVLAKQISSGHSLPDAFFRFQKVRHRKVRRTIKDSWNLAKMAHTSNIFLCQMRNLAMRNIPAFVTRQQSRRLYEITY